MKKKVTYIVLGVVVIAVCLLLITQIHFDPHELFKNLHGG
jgi:hypothetical protein